MFKHVMKVYKKTHLQANTVIGGMGGVNIAYANFAYIGDYSYLTKLISEQFSERSKYQMRMISPLKPVLSVLKACRILGHFSLKISSDGSEFSFKWAYLIYGLFVQLAMTLMAV